MFFVISGDIFVLSPLDVNTPVSSLDTEAAVDACLADPEYQHQHTSQPSPEAMARLEKRTNMRWRRLPAGNYFGAYEALTLKEARLPVVTTSAADLFTISRRDLDSRFRLRPEVLSHIVNHVKADYNKCMDHYRYHDWSRKDVVEPEGKNNVYMRESIRHRALTYQAKLKTAQQNKRMLARFTSSPSLQVRCWMLLVLLSQLL